MKTRKREDPKITEEDRALLLKYQTSRLFAAEDEPILIRFHLLGVIRFKYGPTSKEDRASLTLYGKELLGLIDQPRLAPVGVSEKGS